MSKELKIGLTATSQVAVSQDNSARTMGSGTLDVLATPAMVALMENAAMSAVSDCLAEGTDTVGVEICAKHLRATPIGVTISATATLIAIEGRMLDFEIKASDDKGEIGTATHSRFIVDTERFIAKIKR